MQHITANIPSTACPSWAVWQRQLIKSMNESVYPYLEHFTKEDGEFIWKDEWGGGSADDYYEPFLNWSTLYAIGGGEHLLQLADRQWDAVTKQLTRLGTIHKEYGIDSDNMHQAEQDICFYNLCLADPQSTKLRERAQRFAGFYLNEDPDAINYDPEHKLVLSMRNGSKGAYYPPLEERETASYNPLGGSMETYNLPFFDLPGIDKVEDLADPENARRMGQALFDRWHKGDTPINLSITSLMTNAFLMTGEEKYRSWVVEYTNAWMQRARDNNGIMPDQIGHSGKVGEYVDGKWYGGGGGGWTFPHGFLTIQFATLDAGINAYLLTRDAGYLELPRRQQERIMELGEMRDPAEQYMSVSERWDAQFASLSPGEKTLLFPYRYGDAGWFDWMPMSSVYPSTLWYYSMADEDWQSVERVRAGDAHDWSDVYPFTTRRILLTNSHGCAILLATTPPIRSGLSKRATRSSLAVSPWCGKTKTSARAITSPVAMGQSGLFRGPHSDDSSRAAADLQRRTPARPRPLLRLTAQTSRIARGCRCSGRKTGGAPHCHPARQPQSD